MHAFVPRQNCIEIIQQQQWLSKSLSDPLGEYSNPSASLTYKYQRRHTTLSRPQRIDTRKVHLSGRARFLRAIIQALEGSYSVVQGYEYKSASDLQVGFMKNVLSRWTRRDVWRPRGDLSLSPTRDTRWHQRQPSISTTAALSARGECLEKYTERWDESGEDNEN